MCPSCSAKIEHRPNFVLSIKRTNTIDGVRTRVIANNVLVVHTCETCAHDEATSSDVVYATATA
jgi:hypothetical protein